MMGLDDCRRALDRYRLYDVGIQSALHQKIDSPEFARLFLKYLDELVSDNFPFAFGIRYAGQPGQESFSRSHTDNVEVHLTIRFQHFFELIFPKQASVYEYAGLAVADRATDQSRGH